MLLGVTIWTLPKLGTEFLPELNEGALYMTFTLPTNSSLTEGRKLVPQVIGKLEHHPTVSAVLSQLGRPEADTRKTAARQLTALLGEPIDVDPAAAPDTQKAKREKLRARIEKK